MEGFSRNSYNIERSRNSIAMYNIKIELMPFFILNFVLQHAQLFEILHFWNVLLSINMQISRNWFECMKIHYTDSIT